MAENGSELLREDDLLRRPFEVEVQRTANGGEKLKFIDIITASTSDELALPRDLTIKTFQDGNGKITSTQIEFRRHLRPFMQDLLKDHPGLNLEADPIVFREPFHPLIYKFDQLISDSDRWDSTLRHALADLLAFLLYKEERNIRQLRTTRDTGQVEFSNLWMAFCPGEIVAGRNTDGCNCILLKGLEIIKKQDGSEIMSVRGNQFVFCPSANSFGYGEAKLEIPEFSGYRTICDLEVAPLQFLNDLSQIESECINRGRRWIDLWKNVACQEYEGFAGVDHVTGRVVLDVFEYYDAAQKPRNRQPVLSTEYPIRPISTMSHSSLSDKELMLLPDTIPGYSCAIRKWLMFKVNKLNSPKFRTDAWDDLRVPDATKDCIMKLVSHHKPPLNDSDKKKERQALQKGFGLVFLLHGPPGTGKTLTAECLAETLHKPLAYIAAQDVLTQGTSMDTYLSSIFRRVKRWNAVILIDEADDFLRRNRNECKPELMYKAFISTIEAFTGVLFMTTNFTSTFEPALLSRVSAKFSYTAVNTQRLCKALTARIEASSAFDGDNAAHIAATYVTKFPKLDFRMVDSVIYIAEILARAENLERPLLTEEIIETAIKLKGMELNTEQEGAGARTPGSIR